jgi:hypothetical protein
VIEWDGKFFPDGETHIQKWMKTTNQKVGGRARVSVEKAGKGLYPRQGPQTCN